MSAEIAVSRRRAETLTERPLAAIVADVLLPHLEALTRDLAALQRRAEKLLELEGGLPNTNGGPQGDGGRWRSQWEAIRREETLHALRVSKGNIAAAARMLRCGRKTIYARLTRWGVDREGVPL